MNNNQNYFDTAKRIVVKVGSGVLTDRKNNGLNVNAVKSISGQICWLIDKGLDVILVSSGAMASGIKKVGLAKRPDSIPLRQAASAVGQASLIIEYEKAFAKCKKQVAQILLTGEDLNNRQRYLNARNTICALLSWKVVPIINENDTVAVEEIKFGDNDNLAAMIALLMSADILINLTDIDGLYTKNPHTNLDAELIQLVPSITKNIEKIASDIPGPLGTGGMLSKIKAAKKVTATGIPMIIANGTLPDTLQMLFSGEICGTFFAPKKRKLASRKCWIGFTLKHKGVITIDDGAANAILTKGKSLLPSGIIDVEGEFEVAAPVRFKNNKNESLGTGLVNYSASEIRKIMGLKSCMIKKQLGYQHYDEVIHRDNLVIMSEK